jgi:hypothetical protein
MISLIERGKANATAVVLERLATALGVALADLFTRDATSATDPISRKASQPVWTDPASGYVRRSVSPDISPIRLVDVSFPGGARVAYESASAASRLHQLVWVLAGRIDIKIGDDAPVALATGDCFAHRLDRPVTFHNPTERSARYVVAIADGPRTEGVR